MNMGTIECGREAAKEFAFDTGYLNLNHGSYGTYPLQIRDVLRDYQAQVEARPDDFVRYKYRTRLLDECRQAIADYVHAPLETCVLVPNTSYAVDAVLRNLQYQTGDVIISFSTIYGAFANTLTYLSETTPVAIEEIKYTLPVPDSHLCEALEATITKTKAAGNNPRLAIFDTVTSLPGCRMPFEKLIKICKKHDVYSCVDGAHGVGMMPLDLTTLDPDFFASNCHKWLYTPRGSALFYVPTRNQHLLRATFPVSYGFGSDFAANFASIGTLDDTPYLTIPAALEWRKRITWEGKTGEDAIDGYMESLAREGGRVVAQLLQTEVLENDEGTLGNCSLTNVRLQLPVPDDAVKAEEIGQWMMREMMESYSIALNVFVYANAWWVRLSAQIYLTLEEFEKAGKRLQEVCSRVEEGEERPAARGR